MNAPDESPLLATVAPWLPALTTILLWLAFRHGWSAAVQDPDLWWQVWAGEHALTTGFPHSNLLSWTAPDYPWISHEPLVALLYGWLGVGNLGMLKGVLVSACGLVLLALGWRSDHAWASVLAVLWALAAYRYGVTLRALTWASLCIGVFLLVLFRWDSPRRLPVAALLVWLWAWVHGSFVLGVAMLALVSPAWAAGAALLTLLNPNGLALWGLVAGYGVGTGSQALVHAYVAEWAPLWRGGWEGAVTALCLVIAGALLLSGRDWRAKVLFLGAAALAISHQRYSDVLALLCLPFLADRLAELLPRHPARNPVPFAAAGFLLMGLVLPTPTLDRARYPEGIAEEIPTDARLWNAFTLGGYLGQQGVRVFFDPRNDCYPPDVLADGFAVEAVEDGWQAVLDRRGIDHVLTADLRLQTPLIATGWRVKRSWPAGEGTLSLLVAPGYSTP